jgi:hypothetical protein
MIFWNNANTVSNTIWALLESVVIIGAPVFLINKKFDKMEKRLDKIEYAIFNEGKTGLKNRVEDIWNDLPEIKSDVKVIQTQLNIKD